MSNHSIMTIEQRALQVSSVLALAAITRTVLTYGEVGNLTGLSPQCGHELGHLFRYCQENNLPLLSSLAVEKHTGRPSGDLYDGIDIMAEHRRCFAYDWLNHKAPTPNELQAAYAAAPGKAA